MIKEIENITNIFFDKLNFKFNSIDILNEKDNIFLITLKTENKEDSSLIIGPHGKNLENIKTLLRLIIIKNIDQNSGINNDIKPKKSIILHLEVNDYLKGKNDKLISLINRKVSILKKTNKDIILPVLSSYERKSVHGFISELGDDNIYTKSEGEGLERRLHICIKNKIYNQEASKLSIDINGNDI